MTPLLVAGGRSTKGETSWLFFFWFGELQCFDTVGWLMGSASSLQRQLPIETAKEKIKGASTSVIFWL